MSHARVARSFDSFLKQEAPPGLVVVVCCLAGWLPQCRRVEPALELLNGELYAKSEAEASEGSKPGPEFLLCKFDMSEHNINTLPMYLMYFSGQLCYASNTFKGFGTSTDDLKAQVRETREAAQRGVFLSADFKFGSTSNNLVESFGETLSGTTTLLGASAKPF
ncbi:MAG: hypothetical protein SGPRY_009888 [Prymnesium sp.]